MKALQIQHGDVLLKPIIELPNGLTRGERKNGKWVIAEGEATGHNHVITQVKDSTVWFLEKDGMEQMYLEVTAPVTITHEEHKPLTIPTGIYEIGRVKEYDYFLEMERQVRD